MKFAELLRDYIGDKTLDEVVSNCAIYGVSLDRTYVSRLRSGTRPAPDDDTTVQALANACGRDQGPLLLLARTERKPAEVLQDIIIDAVLAVDSKSILLLQLLDERNRIEDMLRAGASSDEALQVIRNSAKAINAGIKTANEKHDAFFQKAIYVSDERTTESGAFPKLDEWAKEQQRQGQTNSDESQELADAITQLAKVAEVPAVSIWAAVIAAKASQKQPNQTHVLKYLARFLSRRATQTDPDLQVPRNHTEQLLADCLLEATGRRVGMYDNVGSVLQQPEVAEKIGDALEFAGLSAPSGGLAPFRTLAALALAIDQQMSYVRPSYVGPRNPVEERLIAAFETNADFRGVGVADDVFRLATNVDAVADVVKSLSGFDLKPAANYQKGWRTLAELATMVELGTPS